MVEYECELEIADSKFLSSFRQDVLAMRGFARKFLLNQICLGKIVSNIVRHLSSRNGFVAPDVNAGKLLLSAAQKESLLNQVKSFK